jgi:hypothetical protein
MVRSFVLAAALLTLPTWQGATQQMRHSNGHMAHDHFGAVNKRGDMAMGFDHSKTSHHFLLYPDGGAIAVEANDKSDTQSRDAIRGHLKGIRTMFAEGDFHLPMLIHGVTPPGMTVMKQQRKRIAYTFEPTAQGAQVRLTTQSAAVRDAIHKFLRFQIADHRSGDPLTVQPR